MLVFGQKLVSRATIRWPAVSSTQIRHFSPHSNDPDAPRHQRPLTKAGSINSSFTLAVENALNIEQEEDSGGSLKRRLSNSLVGENVHASYSSQKEKDRWKKRPLFNRGGVEAVFKTGTDAANLLVQEARRRDPYQGDFLDAVEDIIFDLAPAIEEDPTRAWIFKQLMEPERLYTFRVPWKDENSSSRINRGFLIHYNSSLGSFNGEIVFIQGLSHGLSRMLGWENSLRCSIAAPVGKPSNGDSNQNIISFGGLTCGSDFDPEDKTDGEVRAFCNSFMNTLSPLLEGCEEASSLETGTNVGIREIGFLKEAYKGDMQLFGMSYDFPESKGSGCVYFAEKALSQHRQKSLEGMRCIISGSGLLSRSIAKQLLKLGAIPLTLSDDSGLIYAEHGLTLENIERVEAFRAKNVPLSDFARTGPTSGTKKQKVEFIADVNIFRQSEIEAEVVFAAKGMGEVNVDDAACLEDKEIIAVFECLDKGVTTNARMLLADRDVLFAPAKAVGCGTAVATGFVQAQVKNTGNQPTAEEVDHALKTRMAEIEVEVSSMAELYNLPGNLKAGANLLSFLRIAKKESLPHY